MRVFIPVRKEVEPPPLSVTSSGEGLWCTRRPTGVGLLVRGVASR